MTNEDHDMLLSLRQQQADLQEMLARLTAQLGALEARTGVTAAELILPPVPPEAFLPPIPEAVELPPIPVSAGEATLPPGMPPLPETAQARHESRIGGWFVRIGAIFAILFLAMVASAVGGALHLGGLGRFGLMGLVSGVVMFIGGRFDRETVRSSFGRFLVVAGLIGLYFSFCEAYTLTTTWKVPQPVLGGILLQLWTYFALLVAERRKSQPIGVLGIFLGYLSAGFVPDTAFCMGADLFLTATAAAFLLRRGWTTLATFSALGTYYSMFHRLIFDSSGTLVLDTSRTLPFLPPAVYLIGAWTIFTAAIILCTTPAFRGGKRLFFTSLNNGAFAFLMALTAYIAGYGLSAVGWTLFDTGLVFLVVSRFAGFAEQDPVELMSAYAAQGLAVFTAGVIVVFTGVTRAFLLLLETLLLGIAGAFAGDRVLTISTYAAGFFATIFSIWQIANFAHHPWLLGLGGALIMLINAWASRSEVRHSRVARSSTVVSTTCYCLLALALIFAAFNSEMTDASFPVALAFGALVLTFAIYHFSIFELPSLAQFLMIAALFFVLFPAETGEDLPGWTTAFVALSTLVLLTWWCRQRLTKPGAWIRPLTYIYALALTYLAALTVRPYLDAEGWMVAESVIATLFLTYGAVLRVWPLAITGQLLLVLSLLHVFFPPQSDVYPWSGIAAVLPLLVTFLTGRAMLRWVHLFPEIAENQRTTVQFFADIYKLIALLGVMRLVFGLLPASVHMAALFFLGAFLFATCLRHPSSFGVRCSFLVSAVGMCLCFGHDDAFITKLSGFSILLFVAQAPLLIPSRSLAISRFEGWFMTLAAVFTGWFFVSALAWPHAHGAHSHLSAAWALYALFLFLLGRTFGQGRLRWCGLAILFITMLRVLCVDLWHLSGGFRIATVFLLVVIMLGIGLSLLLSRVATQEDRTKNL